MLKGKTIVLGVTGGIACFKAAALASMLVKQHANVQVIMTENATKFVTPLTFEQLTGRKALTDTFDRNFQHSVEHIAVADRACELLPQMRDREENHFSSDASAATSSSASALPEGALRVTTVSLGSV